VWIVATVAAFAVVAFCVWSAKSGLHSSKPSRLPRLTNAT